MEIDDFPELEKYSNVIIKGKKKMNIKNAEKWSHLSKGFYN